MRHRSTLMKSLIFQIHLLFALSLFSVSCSHFNQKSQGLSAESSYQSAREIASRPAQYSESCANIVQKLLSQPSSSSSTRNFTRLELELGANNFKQVEPNWKRVEKIIQKIELTSPESARLARQAVNLREQRGLSALKIDTAELPQKMVRFLEGPFADAHGSKSLYGPFIDFRAIDSNTLLIYHAEDLYPIIVRWGDVLEPETQVRPSNYIQNLGIEHEISGLQVLTLPRNFTAASELRTLQPEVFNISSASRFHLYKWEESAYKARFRSLFFDETEFYSKPTQREFSQLRELLNTDLELRQQIQSLLFVAPTGVGKTRVLGLGVADKVQQALTSLSSQTEQPKKLSIVMANTANLVDQLGRDIGGQLAQEVGLSRFRIVQWGGTNTEQMSLDQLIRFIDESDVPVVLVSSFQTVASRIREDSGLTRLMSRSNLVAIDEAHNSSGNTYKRIMNIAKNVAQDDRQSNATVPHALDIMGVTATPSSRSNPVRTVDLFDYTYRAGETTPRNFSYQIKNLNLAQRSAMKNDMLEWYSVEKQRRLATRRGEINSPDEFTYMKLNRSLFFTQGNHPRVSPTRLEQEWPNIAGELDVRAPGIIHTYPRDARAVSETLSKLTGKNYVSDADMTVAQRDALYTAFKNGELYNGQKIDALIIGRNKLEGLNFPDAGWFVSLKRYSYFPDNIQEAGRAMRLANDKPTPAIIFFAENTGSSVYKGVRDFVMSKMGRLPRQMAQGRGFVGARRFENSHPGSQLGESTLDLNVAMELLFRQNQDLARQFNQTSATRSAAIEQFHDLIGRTIRQHGNMEASRSFRTFVNEVNSYPFFKGNLKDTWRYCDKLIQIKRRGKPFPKGLEQTDLAILNNSQLMDHVREFREMRNWIGNVGRDTIETMNLSPRGVFDMAEVLDSFVLRYGDKAPKILKTWDLHDDLIQMINTSSTSLWNRMGFKARATLEQLFLQADELPFEQGINQYVINNGRLPDFYFSKLASNEVVSMEDKIAHRLAERLQARVQSGRLNFDELDPEVIRTLDSDPFIHRIIGQATGALENEITQAKNLSSPNIRRLTYQDLLSEEGLGAFRILEALANMQLPNAIQTRRGVERILTEV